MEGQPTGDNKPAPDGKKRPRLPWRKFRISKGGGRYRTIYAPRRTLKSRLRRVLPFLACRCLHLDVRHVLHGFMPFRSAVTNARAHTGFRYTLSFDLADFFDTVTPTHLAQFGLPTHITTMAFVDGHLPQGFPTSPSLANIAGVPMDRLLMLDLDLTGCRYAYTRYADDLTISFDDHRLTEHIRWLVPGTAQICGFRVNRRKTRFQTAKRGRRIVTGVSVGETDVRPPRSTRRRLRSLSRLGYADQAAGMAAWCRLTIPRRSAIVGQLDQLIDKYLAQYIANPEHSIVRDTVGQLSAMRSLVLLSATQIERD